MKKYLIRFLSVLMVLSLVLSLSGCGEEKAAVTTFLSYSEQNFEGNYSTTGVVFENENLALKWDNATKRVSFEEKKTGCIAETPAVVHVFI